LKLKNKPHTHSFHCVVALRPEHKGGNPRLTAAMSDTISLNVGGHLFTTTRQTLTREPQSMLGRMFAPDNKVPLARDAHGNVFLDRDGRHFASVLNYLRDGHLSAMPADETTRLELLSEGRYFLLDGLVRLLVRAPWEDEDTTASVTTVGGWQPRRVVQRRAARRVRELHGDIYTCVTEKIRQYVAEAEHRGDEQASLAIETSPSAAASSSAVDMEAWERVGWVLALELQQAGYVAKCQLRESRTMANPARVVLQVHVHWG
jgi:hypothetical protein